MNNKNKLVLLGFLAIVIVVLILFGNAIQNPEKKAIKEIGASMVSRDNFNRVLEENYNYKAMAALTKTLANGDRIDTTTYFGDDPYVQAKLDFEAISRAVDDNYTKVTNIEVAETKSALKDQYKDLEIPNKKLKVKEISKSEKLIFPCFTARKVTYKDSSGNLYFYTFLFYDNKIVDIQKK